MNKKIDDEFTGIKDIYVLQATCTELKDRVEKYRHLFKTTKTEELIKENERLHSIIKEVIEYIEEHKQKGYRTPMSDDYEFWNELDDKEIKELLEILDKEKENEF